MRGQTLTPKKSLTPAEAEGYTGVTKKKLKELADDGYVKRKKLGHRTVKYLTESLDRFMASNFLDG